MLDHAFYWQARAELKTLIRKFFQDREFIEVDTPILVPCPGAEIHLNYFAAPWQDHRHHQHPLYLRSSPEIHMKQVLTQGLPRIFQLAQSFRNGGELSDWHNPEFTMLEWYQVGISYEDFMEQTVELLRYSAKGLQNRFPEAIKFMPPKHFRKMRVAELFWEFAGIELTDNDADLGKKAVAKGIGSVKSTDAFETAFFKIIFEQIEPRLKDLGAVVVYDYPASMAALAKVEHGVARRFEIYVNGIELCNAFDELCSQEENLFRLKEINRERTKLQKPEIPIDQPFIDALQRNLPQCCGCAMGFDRWLAILLGETRLDAVLPFRKQIFMDPAD